jgi:hypothetical protein
MPEPIAFIWNAHPTKPADVAYFAKRGFPVYTLWDAYVACKDITIFNPRHSRELWQTILSITDGVTPCIVMITTSWQIVPYLMSEHPEVTFIRQAGRPYMVKRTIVNGGKQEDFVDRDYVLQGVYERIKQVIIRTEPFNIDAFYPSTKSAKMKRIKQLNRARRDYRRSD